MLEISLYLLFCNWSHLLDLASSSSEVTLSEVLILFSARPEVGGRGGGGGGRSGGGFLFIAVDEGTDADDEGGGGGGGGG